MSDDLPSSTPENGGDDKTAANKAGDENDNKVKKEGRPRKPRVEKNIVPWGQIFDLGGTGLVFWVWAEIIKCHDLDVLIFLGATLTVFQAGPCHFIYSLLKKFRWSFKLSFFIWVVLAVLTWSVVRENSRPEKSPLGLSLTTSDSSDFVLELTNDFLTTSKPVFTSGKARGCLLMPISPNKTNVSVVFFVENNSDEAYEDVDVTFVLPPELNWTPAPPWNRIAHWVDVRTGVEWPLPITLNAHEGINLPPITFGDSAGVAQFVTAFIKAKNMKSVNLVFWIAVAHMKPEMQHPVVVLGTRKTANGVLNFSPP
jgi:uncharacterized protein with PQ loop repeat